jgi:GNAT superfamily N-acetyltransferase
MLPGDEEPPDFASSLPMSGSSIIIRAYRDDDPIPSITRLLQEAYAPLAAMGLRYTATHQDDATTLRRLTRGFPFVAELEGEIVATVTLYPTESAPGACCRWYAEPGVFSFGQFAVHPDLQRQGLGAQLIRMLENEALARGATELALDTAEPAVHLRSWYEKLGFRFIELADWSTTNYRSVILSKTLAPSDP